MGVNYNIESFTHELRDELKNILGYWRKNVIDDKYGGFKGRIDGFNQTHDQAPKGSILNTRILWSFSASWWLMQNEQDATTARRTYDYLLTNFWDNDFGGVYWKVDYLGNPIDSKKQIYAQAFAIYALSEYYLITHDQQVLEKAIAIFHLIEDHSFDNQLNGYLEAFDRQWVLLDDLRLSDKDANEKKTMNTHLHVLEAYTSLYRIWKDPKLAKQLNNLIRIFTDKILNSETWHLNLFFDEHWNTKSEIYSFGHDIEASWLICEAAEVLGDEMLIKKSEDIAVNICRMILQEGLDIDGAIYNEGKGGIVIDTDKHWWPQAEAMVGFINAWQINKDEKFLKAALQVWSFIKAAIIDHKEGEWYFRVNKFRQPYMQEDKAGFWKCPYHNSRACIELINRLYNIKANE